MTFIGRWWLVLYSSKNKLIEIGIGENPSSTNSVYQVKEKRFLCFYLSIVKPTLKYLKEESDRCYSLNM